MISAKDRRPRRQRHAFLEQQLRQSQKMEAVGRLAGGLAHDFNNLLTVILGCAELIAGDLPQDDPQRQLADEIRKAGQRAASLTHQLLAFSRSQVLRPEVLDLNEVTSGVRDMVRRLIDESIQIHTRLGPALSPVKVDRGQLEQVLVNLLVNARDAMPAGGILTIETANTDLNAGFFRHHALPPAPGPYVRLSISDEGVGMDGETQARIFEPFFTTKEKGKGTGLGLSTVYGIVKQSGGYILVESEPGRGTTFHAYLPHAREALTSTPVEKAPTRALRGIETVLIVEDSAAVRRLAAVGLSKVGYHVHTAGTGEEALELSEAFAGPLHLLITDLVLPRISGRELAHRIGQQRPETRVLYMSGYTEQAVLQPQVLEATVSFISKPFTPESLAAKVREVLDTPTTPAGPPAVPAVDRPDRSAPSRQS